jgi:hypothetical protein
MHPTRRWFIAVGAAGVVFGLGVRGEVGRMELFLAPVSILLVAAQSRRKLQALILMSVVVFSSFARGWRQNDGCSTIASAKSTEGDQDT